MIEAIGTSSTAITSLDKYFDVYSGEDKTLYIQINMKDEAGNKEPLDITGASSIEIDLPVESGILTLSLSSSPAIVVDNPIFGKVHIDLTSIQTNVMIGGSAMMRIVKASKNVVAIASTIRKMVVPGC